MQFETLEHRELMAGNVTASIVAGDLVITGDNASNGVVVSRINDTTFQVRGSTVGGAGTRINGTADVNGNGRVQISGVRDDLRVNLNGGNDEINFHGTSHSRPMRVPDDLVVYTQAGNDEVGMFDVKAGSDIIVNMGSGVDQFVAETITTGNHVFVKESATPFYAGDSNFVNIYDGSRIGGQLNVKLNQGNDAIKVSDTSANSLWLEGRAGNDSIFIDHVTTTFDIRIDPGYGSDRTTVQYCTVGDDVMVVENSGTRSSSDKDYVTVTDCTVKDYIWVSGNRGKESVRINRSTVNRLYASLGAGDDWLNIKYTNASSWSLNGGSGSDSLNRYGNSAHFGSRGFDHYSYRSSL